MLLKCSIIWSSNGFRDTNKHYSIVLYWGEIHKERWYQNKYNTLKCLLFSCGETVTSNSWMLALHCIKSKQATNPHTQELPAISFLSQICSSQEDLDCPESSVPHGQQVCQTAGPSHQRPNPDTPHILQKTKFQPKSGQVLQRQWELRSWFQHIPSSHAPT